QSGHFLMKAAKSHRDSQKDEGTEYVERCKGTRVFGFSSNLFRFNETNLAGRWSEDLMQVTEGAAGSRTSIDRMDSSLERCRPQAMPSGRHRGHSLPLMPRGIIGFVLAKCSFRTFAAEDIEPVSE